MDLPYNLDAEKQILANMIISKNALTETITSLTSDDFYHEPHRIIYDTLLEIFKDSADVKLEPSILIDRLSIENNLEKIGGAGYIVEICESYIDVTNYKHYINTVKERAVLRKLIEQCNDVVKDWKNELSSLSVSDYINKINKSIENITKERKIADFETAESAIQKYTERIQEISSGKHNYEGVMCSSIPTLNRITLGFHPGELIILAARPGEGKSALALNLLVEGIARLNNKKAGVLFSLEMPILQLTERMLALKSGIDIRKIQTANFTKDEETVLSRTIRELQELNLWIDETPRLRVMDMRAKLQNLQAAHGDIGFIVVDYLGLIAPDFQPRGATNRVLELGEITANLRAIAKDFNAPILVLAQLNREAERDGKEPQLSNLRESGNIEQDADIVLFLHRLDIRDKKANSQEENKDNNNKNEKDKKLEEINKQTEKPNANNKQDGRKSEIVEDGKVVAGVNLIIAKHRAGSKGKIPLRFIKNTGRFIENEEDSVRSLVEDN